MYMNTYTYACSQEKYKHTHFEDIQVQVLSTMLVGWYVGIIPNNWEAPVNKGTITYFNLFVKNEEIEARARYIRQTIFTLV